MPFAVRGGGRQVCVFALLPPLSGRGLRYIDCLTEIEEAKASGSTTNTTVAETTCVSGSWPSRGCSLRRGRIIDPVMLLKLAEVAFIPLFVLRSAPQDPETEANLTSSVAIFT
ncbi:hypothetical protein PF011_g18743 [Phytophthora fragariae]|uniref:Uncharacterized protein n=1 Tax=Phytophthora fragariae TaxID=53985 RepID=A0A6A3J5E2_9STRA|nr:hypothetical protein PF011_g18743 [Phytophthora fragariae]